MTEPAGRPPEFRPLAMLGSLRLTVVLLGMSVFLVFVGTLAQAHGGTWTAVAKYFRCWIAWVELKVFFKEGAKVAGEFPFPGGWLIGTALLVNLLVSHAQRIRLQATGARLLGGAAVTGLGALLTWFVITSAVGADGTETKVSPALRVSLQLLQGGAAAAVLFLGCVLLFKRKAGIVLLHAGIVMMMLSELVTGLFAVEGMMTIYQGQKGRYAVDNRKVELSIVDPSDPAHDDVVVVPQWLLEEGGRVDLPGLPFSLEVPEGSWMLNAGLSRPKPDQLNRATQGAGLEWVPVPRAEEKGTDGDPVNLPAVYATFKDKSSGAPLGTWLASIFLTLEKGDQPLSAGGRTWLVSLRFKRDYKPYSVFLKEFSYAFYPGTQKPKDFSAYVKLEDPDRSATREARIWMNNPMRYGNETLYQSSWDPESQAFTVLQIVENGGWMVPYVGCMIVGAGLLGQFLLHLGGFLRKRGAA